MHRKTKTNKLHQCAAPHYIMNNTNHSTNFFLEGSVGLPVILVKGILNGDDRIVTDKA